MVTLYKLDSKDKIRTLEISTRDNILIQTSGLIDGAKIINESVCEPKNVGKTNATTGTQQAISEAESKVREKLKEGYFETLEEAKDSNVILPMLALDIKKLKKPIDWTNCYVQPKLDGMRCLGNYEEMKSCKNTPIETMPHIQKELEEIAFKDYLDGELYEHGKTFQENMKLIKKYRGLDSLQVKYHVYDMVLPNMDFENRYILLKSLVKKCIDIELVPTFKVNSMGEVNKYHSIFLEDGYEGTIIRWGDAGYEVNKRSKHLLKKKDFMDIACEVVDIIPSEKRPEQGIVVCKMSEQNTKAPGALFKATPKMSHTDRKHLLLTRELQIKKIAEIRFFEYTDEGLPRFPVCVGFRDDK